MALSNQLKNQHLMWRAGFGPAVEQLGVLDNTSPEKLYKALQKASAKRPQYLQAADSSLQGLMLGIQDAGRLQKQEMSPEQRKEMRQRSREGIKSLNLYWLKEMVDTDAQLREKIAFFWHGHFACRNLNVFYQQQLLDVIRQNALGNFGDLLHEVSKTGAMLNFLNNNQNKKDHHKVEWLADRFYKSDYDIGKLIADIFTSDWFYDEKNIGSRIKSPIELLVGIQRILPMKLENEEALLLLERVLGQILFYPPNVAGWPGGRSWIDSSTLMMRMRIPQLINDTDDFNVKPKSDDDQMMGRSEDEIKIKSGGGARAANAARVINAHVDWSKYLDYYNKVAREQLVNDLAGILLQTRKAVGADVINEYADATNKETFIKTSTIQIMSTPEYQLC